MLHGLATNLLVDCLLLQAEVNLKIKKAYCPPKIVEGNPCLEYIKYIIFPWFGEFVVVRTAENGGDRCVL